MKPVSQEEPDRLRPLELPNVMLCAVSSVALDLTVRALKKSCQAIAFGDVVMFSDQASPEGAESGIRWQKIPHIETKEAYSNFMLKELAHYATRPFVLVIQWDGYIVNPGLWRSEFLNYDYIGALWPQFDDGMTVGNGGFSLRSRHLLEATASSQFPAEHPEDVAICRVYRPCLERDFGLRFAPEHVASTFACERKGALEKSFGFHGAFKFPSIVGSDDIGSVVRDIPNFALTGNDCADLILSLSQHGNRLLAWQTLGRRLRAKVNLKKDIPLIFALIKRHLTRVTA